MCSDRVEPDKRKRVVSGLGNAIQVASKGVQVAGEGIQGVSQGIRISVKVFSVLAMKKSAFFTTPNARGSGLRWQRVGRVVSGSGRGMQVAGRGIQVAGEGIQGDFEGIQSSLRVFSCMAMQKCAFFTAPDASGSGLEFPYYNIRKV